MPANYNKYKAKRVTHGAHTFDSNGEAQCYGLLELMERAGEIKDLRHQMQVHIVAGINYRADYHFWDVKLGEFVFGEYKGFETPEWRLKLKLWKVFGPGRLRIWRGKYPRYSIEDVIPSGFTDENRS